MNLENDAHVLIVDGEHAFATDLGRSFHRLGFPVWLSTDLKQARHTSDICPPRLIISELRIDGKWAFDVIPTLRRPAQQSSSVIVTAYPSIATAVRAMRCGFTSYVAKPVNAFTILELVNQSNHQDGDTESTGDHPTTWPSLSRTTWEYINQVVVVAGSISEAARRLGVDRRSLRRMLAKYPPMR